MSLYRLWRLALIGISHLLHFWSGENPSRPEKWFVEQVLYGDGVRFGWSDVWRVKQERSVPDST